MKNIKYFLKIITIVSAVIFSVLLFFTIIFFLYTTYKIPYNNLYLKFFQESFNVFVNPMHPKQSNLIAEMAEVGNWADGTKCHFFVGQFRSSPLSKETIQQFYFKESMYSGIDFVDEINENNIIDNPWFEWKEKYLKNYRPRDGENTYLIWISDQDKPTDGDIRCE